VPATRWLKNWTEDGAERVMVGSSPRSPAWLTRTHCASVRDSVPPATRDLNRRAFDKGYEYGLRRPAPPSEEREHAPLEAE